MLPMMYNSCTNFSEFIVASDACRWPSALCYVLVRADTNMSRLHDAVYADGQLESNAVQFFRLSTPVQVLSSL